jgi:hypothetical protein
MDECQDAKAPRDEEERNRRHFSSFFPWRFGVLAFISKTTKDKLAGAKTNPRFPTKPGIR